MMSLLKRFRYTLEADLHALFDKKEAKNPIAMLNQYIREAEKQTEQTGKLLERQRLLKEELEQNLKETGKMLERRTNQLELAKASGEEDLILFATQEVETYKSRQMTLQESLNQANEEVIQLEQKFEMMKHKIQDMKVRQLQLMGKENVVRANVKMNRVLNSEDMNFHELSTYIDQLSNKIEKNYEYTQLETRLALLEQQSTKNNDETSILSSKE
ncbi:MULTISPECIES: PspA/IM30 family protein [Ureibacillus]|jgi:lia operon protein LiaH|uniref:Phage shock protein A n=1 Tax=Ureibacillus thermosphaericus TaxID=51173 RepID=A0A840PPH8_URETH|nr:PspA/IM30 family protein [Ureibacillus thermosphaericus]MBB5147757.1 phage shock protein A [Ureibacillus thermosphaericus]NKZ30441.1 PspA/IM30 family protein [Ureibacillus thermosphaericus]